MGFIENWIGERMGGAFGRSGTSARGSLNARHAPQVPLDDDFTARPTLDPSVLRTILPRDGNAAFTVSGLDGVLTVGKDMVMTTDQPVRCETIRVLGTLEATVYASKIVIAEGGSVLGDVVAQTAEVRGSFEGSLRVRGSVTLHPRSRTLGKVRALDLFVSANADTHGADMKRVVPRALDDGETAGPTRGFDEGFASMHITVTEKAAFRR